MICAESPNFIIMGIYILQRHNCKYYKNLFKNNHHDLELLTLLDVSLGHALPPYPLFILSTVMSPL